MIGRQMDRKIAIILLSFCPFMQAKKRELQSSLHKYFLLDIISLSISKLKSKKRPIILDKKIDSANNDNVFRS